MGSEMCIRDSRRGERWRHLLRQRPGHQTCLANRIGPIVGTLFPASQPNLLVGGVYRALVHSPYGAAKNISRGNNVVGSSSEESWAVSLKVNPIVQLVVC